MQGMSEAKYVTEMIDHHGTAVEMSRMLLRVSPSPELKAFAEKVIEVQTREIQWLRTWARDNAETANMRRSEFDKMSSHDRARFMKNGGHLRD